MLFFRCDALVPCPSFCICPSTPPTYYRQAGIKYLRQLSMRASYRIVCASFIKMNLKPPYWEEYLLIVSGDEYREGKAMNCVCTYCRTLIYENFDDLRSYINMILLPDDMKKRFLRWTHISQRFIAVELVSELKMESSCAFTCATAALSSANNYAFLRPCEHDTPEVSAIMTMDMMARERHGRYAIPEDWDSECYNNCGKDSGKFLTCEQQRPMSSRFMERHKPSHRNIFAVFPC